MVRVYFRLELKVCDRLAPLCDRAAWRIVHADRYSIWWPEIQQVVRLCVREEVQERDYDFIGLDHIAEFLPKNLRSRIRQLLAFA